MKIKNDVLEVLKKAIFNEPSTVILQGELDRKLAVLSGIEIEIKKLKEVLK